MRHQDDGVRLRPYDSDDPIASTRLSAESVSERVPITFAAEGAQIPQGE